MASFLSQSFEVIKYYLDWLPPDTANIHAWLILVTTATTGGGVLFSGRFFAQRANLLELITFEILAAERLRLMGFDNRLIIDCFTNVVNILVWLFSTIDRFRSEKCESNYIT